MCPADNTESADFISLDLPEVVQETTEAQECKLCGKNDHRTRDCHIKTLTEETLQEIAGTQECKCCGENGHWTRNCRVKTQVENMKKKQCRNGPLCRLHEQGLCIFDHSSNKASYQCRYGSECRYLAEGNCAFQHKQNENQYWEDLQRKTEEIEALISNCRRQRTVHQRGIEKRGKTAQPTRKTASRKPETPKKKVKKHKARYWEDRQGLKKAS